MKNKSVFLIVGCTLCALWLLNSGERIPRRLCRGVSEQDTKEVLDGIGFLDGFAARSFNCTSGKKDKEMKIITVTNHSIQSIFPAQPDKSINFKKVKEHFQQYPERWNAAFKFLIESDLNSLPIGRIDLSEDVYAAVSEYETKNPEDARFESHEKYIDLQYVMSGAEIIGLTNNHDLTVISPYDESKDIAFYDFEGGTMLSATPAAYFIFFPEDKHRPCIKNDVQGMVRKVVVKIKYLN